METRSLWIIHPIFARDPDPAQDLVYTQGELDTAVSPHVFYLEIVPPNPDDEFQGMSESFVVGQTAFFTQKEGMKGLLDYYRREYDYATKQALHWSGRFKLIAYEIERTCHALEKMS